MQGKESAQAQATTTATAIRQLPRAESPPFIKLWPLLVIIAEFVLLRWGFTVVQEHSV